MSDDKTQPRPRTRNRLRCGRCNDIIESAYRHDFKGCSCKAIFVDGGKDYFRCGGEPEDIFVVFDDNSEINIAVLWGEQDNKTEEVEEPCPEEFLPTDSQRIDYAEAGIDALSELIEDLYARVEALESKI